jgi:hypothetical protein
VIRAQQLDRFTPTWHPQTVEQAQQLEQAMTDLGLTAEAHASVRQAPSFEAAVARLDAIKAEAKRRYRKLALELHPDRTGGDVDKTERFKVLAQVMDQLEKMRVGRPPAPRPAPPPVRVVVFSTAPGFGYGYGFSGSSGATSTTTGSVSGEWYSPFGVRFY